ncbi:unnamed protein product [Rotaria sp. Silwood2]|nr:unnamed protein product [Rotaria sp. Silwood2]CAF2829832.1 unnamed protein product [Rotaria sp. Silwood2]CAF3079747.1 unnamed protein product [Rotaria sp. Silwood2]CAF3887815.1 unnamed protein product [Rotaria sp. Silwood2]CAF4008600.1 unnamed protein product [Rotaria sp. Silwood2]
MGVSGSQENNEKKPVVLIVGGGYAGTQCAKLLDKSGRFFVVLIDRKSYFLHNVAALRATVERDFAQKIIIPYDRLLTNGCVVQAEVISISSDSVQVYGRNEPISFDYLVIATGSSYAFPGKIAEVEITQAVNLYNNIQEKVKQSQQILVIGGGPVGVELAGEIATDFPEKEITIVHSQPTLLQPKIFNGKVYTNLQEQLEKLNVKIILNDRIQLSNNQHINYIEGKETYLTENTKTSITADLTFLCTGAHVNNRSLLNSSLKSKVNPQTGRIIVNNYLQVDDYENIFAIGDISDKEDKFAFLADAQAEYVAKIIPLIEKKKSYPKEYHTHVNRAILLSVGRNGGVGQLPTKSGIAVGSCIVKHFKSKDMFASRYRSAMNYNNSENQSENKPAYLNKLDSVQSILSFSEEDARNLLAGLPAKELEPGQDFI